MEAENSAVTAEIEKLRTEIKILEAEKAKSEARIEVAKQALVDIKQKLKDEFGVNSLEEAKFKVAQMRAESERLVVQIREQLAQVT